MDGVCPGPIIHFRPVRLFGSGIVDEVLEHGSGQPPTPPLPSRSPPRRCCPAVMDGELQLLTAVRSASSNSVNAERKRWGRCGSKKRQIWLPRRDINTRRNSLVSAIGQL